MNEENIDQFMSGIKIPDTIPELWPEAKTADEAKAMTQPETSKEEDQGGGLTEEEANDCVLLPRKIVGGLIDSEQHLIQVLTLLLQTSNQSGIQVEALSDTQRFIDALSLRNALVGMVVMLAPSHPAPTGLV